MNNNTKQDALTRVGQARIGSLVEPSEEYILALRQEIFRWLEQIDTVANSPDNWRKQFSASSRTI